MLTIGQIGKRFGLSRSTLLYYDAIGLLSPSGRSAANYRLYTASDVAHMEQIRTFRETGLPLLAIKDLLRSPRTSPSAILAQRLAEIGTEIVRLRQQQQVIVKLIGPKTAFTTTDVMTKTRWVAILVAAGLDEEGMHRWHVEFERAAPAAHQAFLASLGLDAREIGLIRETSRTQVEC